MEIREERTKAETEYDILDHNPDLILRITSDGSVIFASRSAYAMTGFSAQELTGKNIEDLVYSSDKLYFQSFLSDVLRGEKPLPPVLRLEKKDGVHIYIEVVSVLTPLFHEDLPVIQVSVRDVTERIHSQKDLQSRYSILEDEVSKRKMIEENLVFQSGFRSSIIQHTDVGISALDRNMVFLEWNPAMEKMTGKHAAEVIGKNWKDLYRDHIDTPIFHKLLRVFEGEKIILKNQRFINKPGFHNTTLVPLYGESQEIIGILSLTHNITDEKILHEKLIESESFLKSITETTPNVISVIDLENDRFLFSNKAFFRLYGGNESELSFQKIDAVLHKIIHPDDLELVTAHIEKVKNGTDEDQFEQEFRIVSDSHTRWFNVKSVSFKRNENGEVVQILANAKEITNRKKAEQELIRSRDLLFQAQKAAKLGVWEWNVENDDIICSDEFYRILGSPVYSKGLSFADLTDLILPEDREMVKDAITSSVFTKKNFSVECRLMTEDDKFRHLLITGTPKLDENGNLKNIIGSGLDITELKDTEALLKKKEEFLSIASHELKTPLTTAKAYIELISKFTAASPDESLRTYISKAGNHIDKLARLISDLLDISKIQSGKMQFDIKPFDLDQMLKENIENLQATSIKHKIRFEGTTNAVLNGDKERLGQVLSNLISNAIKYSPNADEVQVFARREKGEVHISVKDHGIGIDKESYEKIFERFFRVDIKRGHFQGLGIGLFISKEIVLRHNGRIWVESQPEKGSVFTFSLPVE